MAARKKKTLGAKGRAKLKSKADPPPKGRPKIDVDWETIEQYCRAHATQEEVAGFLKCSVDTVSRRIKEQHGLTFQEYSDLHACEGVMSVRRAHFKSAESGDVRAQVSILKQHGGYRETLGVEITERTRIFYPDNGRDPDHVDLTEPEAANGKAH